MRAFYTLVKDANGKGKFIDLKISMKLLKGV